MTNPRPSVEVAEEIIRDYGRAPEQGALWDIHVEAVAALLDRTREEALEKAAKVAEEWANHYPVDVFTPPTIERANQDFAAGFVPDVYSAESARNSSRNIAREIRKLTLPTETADD